MPRRAQNGKGNARYAWKCDREAMICTEQQMYCIDMPRYCIDVRRVVKELHRSAGRMTCNGHAKNSYGKGKQSIVMEKPVGEMIRNGKAPPGTEMRWNGIDKLRSGIATSGIVKRRKR